jgi:hypothetical protein
MEGVYSKLYATVVKGSLTIVRGLERGKGYRGPGTGFGMFRTIEESPALSVQSSNPDFPAPREVSFSSTSP